MEKLQRMQRHCEMAYTAGQHDTGWMCYWQLEFSCRKVAGTATRAVGDVPGQEAAGVADPMFKSKLRWRSEIQDKDAEGCGGECFDSFPPAEQLNQQPVGAILAGTGFKQSRLHTGITKSPDLCALAWQECTLGFP